MGNKFTSTTIFKALDLKHGYVELASVRPDKWGSEVYVTFIYRYPDADREFTVCFSGVQNIEWIVVKSDVEHDQPAQMITHDMGLPNFQRAARLATVVAEITILYDKFNIVS